ncbi:MAG: hypothetical protein HXY39_07825 [Chloroflexi bacterium]|nr:hypothetical protein [Chloroflexota bacterium]
MIIADHRINMDALLARIVFRWHWKIVACMLALLALFGLASGTIPPFWRGRATLHIQSPPEALITVDGRHWPVDLYAGDHTIVAALPDGRRSWVNLTLGASETREVVLPPGLPAPREQQLPAAAPGMHIDMIWRADGAWRLQSAAMPLPEDDGSEEAGIVAATQTVAISARGIERLTTIDAYRGLADMIHAGSTRYEAVYEPHRPGMQSGGQVLVHGWNRAPVVTEGDVSLVRFAPDGAGLLLAERAAAGEQISYVTRSGPPAPVVAVPGSITGLVWQPGGDAVVIASRMGNERTLTLARLRPAPVAAVIAEPPADGLPPHTWAGHDFLWIAPDDDGTPWLWRADTGTLLPERQGTLEARALTMLADGTMRVVVEHAGQVVIGRMQGELLIGEVVLQSVPATGDLVGEWHGAELLLRSGERAWLITMADDDR